MSSILPDVVDATRTAASADAGTPAGTVVLRAAGLRVAGRDGHGRGETPAASELAMFCRPVVTAHGGGWRRRCCVLVAEAGGSRTWCGWASWSATSATG